MRKYLYLGVAGLVLGLAGCATVSTTSPDQSFPTRQGVVYHKVKPKETLWSIAKAYGISVDEIVKVNHIPNAAYIEKDQLIVIPGAPGEVQAISSQEAFGDDTFQWPVKGKVLSYFGETKSAWVNKGIDIKSKYGQEIFPARGGEVVFADFLPGYGQTLIIDHGDSYDTVYAQNAELLASTGDFVKKDVPIAKVGGKDSLAFLHFEIRRYGVADNPLYFLP